MKFHLIILTAILSLSTLAQAGSYSGRVLAIQSGLEYNGSVLVKLDGEPLNMPECSHHTTWHFAFDGRTETGKTFLSMLLAAFSDGNTVAIYGTNNCTLWPTIEDLDLINIR